MLKKLYISFFLLMVSALANASAPQTMYTLDGSSWYTSIDAACGPRAAAVTAGNPGYVYTCTGSSGNTAYYSTTYNGKPFGAGSWTGSVSTRCADGKAPDTSKPLADQCPTPPPTGPKCSTPAGSKVSFTWPAGTSANPTARTADVGTTPPPGYPTSSPSCGLSGRASVDNCYSKPTASGGKAFFCTFTGTSNGVDAPVGTPGTSPAAAPGADSDPANAPPAPADAQGNCPGGTVQGGVDSGGTPICIGSGTNPTGAGGKGAAADAKPVTTVSSKATDAAGNEVETTKESTVNSDGSTTTKTTVTTVAPDGTRSSSTTTETGPELNGKAGKPDAGESDMCKLHPELNVCRNSSVSGSCGTIACQGDAIQCATLRAAAAMQCAQEQDTAAVKSSASKALGDQILGGADPLKSQIDAAIKGTEIDLSKPQLDQSGFLGGGACLANRSISVLGQSVTMDFSGVCNSIQPLRAGIMACAFIVAYLIVSRSVLQS